jgi:glutamate synthase (NADPH/NADH) small chain
MKLRDLLSPFYVWKRTFEKPFTLSKPLARTAAQGYRGFHTNKVDACIGCGLCRKICMNDSIDMVPTDLPPSSKADSGLRPCFDYGRCCWCALCVDVCPTKSLGMSNEFQWVDPDPKVFRFTPGIDHKPWDGNEKGYKKSKNLKL